MRTQILSFLFFVILPLPSVRAQDTIPTFRHTIGQDSYVLVGRDPAQGGTTTIPTVLVPVTLSFEAKKTAGKSFVMDATPDIRRLLRSPVFSPFAFPSGGTTQYGDALLRTTFPQADNWHTLLGPPEVKPVQIRVPVGSGYVLTSRKTGGSLAVLDVEFLQRELFRQVPSQKGKLVIALTHNTTYYALGDATVCCSWGTHGIDSATGNSFVLGSSLQTAPAVVTDEDVQPMTQQLAEFLQDPRHDPLVHDRNVVSGNIVPAWFRSISLHSGDQGSCAGHGVASTYFLLEPTDTNPKNNVPASKAFIAPVHGLIPIRHPSTIPSATNREHRASSGVSL
jgi:chitinase